jgi:hypothetical protein
MQTYNYLPGTIINTVDGGLSTVFAPTDDAVLVLGTAGTGVANSPFQVTDLNAAALTFGFSGSLFQACAEVASYSDNVIAYRIGTSPAELKNVGADTTVGALTPGFTITFNTIEAEASANYQIWYAAGVLAVWNEGQIVFSNQSGAAVDTGDITISSQRPVFPELPRSWPISACLCVLAISILDQDTSLRRTGKYRTRAQDGGQAFASSSRIRSIFGPSFAKSKSAI